MENTSLNPGSPGPEPGRRAQLLREFGDKFVQLGWARPNSPELEAEIDILRQHATEDQIEGLTKAIQRQIAGEAGCGCKQR